MDYDDNDFQSQNLHLAGEGSTKFPPVLRPYALPKFDFDESLQGQLRFDNLVETEVFLGIESNEDNQWIDSYSRGSSGIGFSSTAAESCSISRHNNVWSEATSSESVEMLLKSVGQEEYIPRQSVIQESDACNELACLAKQMESNLKADDKNESRDVAGLQLSDNLHEDGSGLKKNGRRDQPQVGVSQAHENELSFDGSSGNLELSDICENIDPPQSEGIYFTDTKGKNEKQQEVEAVGDDPLNDRILDDSSASGELQTNVTAAPVQNISTTSDSLDVQNVQKQVVGVSGEQQGCLTSQTDRQDTESYTFNKGTNVDTQALDGNEVVTDTHNPDNSVCLSSKEEDLNGESVVKGLDPCLTNVDDSLGVVPSNVSDLQKAERCSEDVDYRNACLDSAGGNAVKDAMKDDQSALTACNSPKVEVKGNTGLEEVIEINNSNFGISPNLQQCVDYVEKKTHGESSFDKEKESLNSGHEMDVEVSVSKAEASSTVEGGNISKTNEHDDSKVEGISCFSMVSTTKSCILGESTQVCEGSEVDKLDDKKFHQDMSIADQDFTRAPSDCSQINRDADEVLLVDKGIDSSSISPGGMETGLSTSSVATDVTAVDNSASKALSDVSFASSGTVDVQPCNVSTQKVTEQNDVQRKTSPVGSNPVDEKEDSAARVAEEAHLSRPIVSSEQGTIPGPVIETERQSCDTSRQLSWETVDNCTKIVEICATGNVSEPPKTMNHNQESAKEMDVCSTVHKPTAKQDEVNPPSKISGGMLLANQGSGSSAPLSDSHVELHEPVGGPAYSTCSPSITAGRSSKTEKNGNQNPPVSELINKDATNVLLTDDSFKGNDASKDKGSLTPELNTEADLSKNNAADSTTNSVENSQPVPATRASKASTVVEVSPSGLGPSKIKTAGDTSHGSPQISDGEIARSISKSTPQRKTRRTSSKTAGKESSRKASRVKETPPARQPERADTSNNAKLSSPPGFQLMQSNEMLQYGHIDSGSAKPFALLNASTASLPDLNTSASSPVLFQQPFTDLQQIQLRAQIFVYGALIQGIAPDEAYMISAFGGPDGGRSLWENVWRVCVERQHSQKSLLMNPETPVQTRSGSRASELAKQGSQQSKGISSPLGRSSSKATPTVVNPLIPLSSPLWNLPTPSDSLQPGALIRGSVLDYPRVPSSLHTYQTPPVRNNLGHNTSWISQAPVRSPWIAPPAPDTSSLFSASPISDSVKLNSVKGSSLPPSSGIKSVTPGLLSSSAAPQSIFVGTAPLHDTNSVTVSPPPHSSDPKPKRRKKVTISEDLGQKALQTQPQLELNSVVSSHLSTSVVLATTVGSVPKTTVEKSIVSLSSLSPADHLKIDRNIEKRFLSDESLTKVKEAGAHAEEAAALSAAAVNHSLEIWTQLDKQKNSGLVSVIEAELASAAVTVAAAAAVAKAAAAAAKVASNAALQAKLMAEEALASSSNEGTSQSNGISHSEGIKILGKATPASILKGPNGIGSSSSIIVAAKEVSRRRVEAASAAAKQAENMDAIVKAAELAAEAVSQAGKIVTMGDPLHISKLVEAGPQGRWEAAHDSFQQVGSSNSKTRGPVNIDNVGDNATISHTLARNIPSDGVGMKVAASGKSPLHKGYDERSEDHTRPMDESEIELHDPSFVVANVSEKLGETSIKEGSLVEVFKDGGEGCQAAWFTANVLSLNDGKAYVCYSVLVAEGGAGPLKEWVPLESEGDKPPKIRIARPLAGTSYEGTRKRRRAATRDYACSVGHRVDVWIQESWQEGIVKENKKDEITVDFPARGETVVVRAWQVRSSLFWKDGKWIEYSSLGANVNSSHEGDTPREKRPKLGGPTGEAKGKDKMLKSIEGVEPADPNKLRLLDLSEKEKVFNVGKNSKNEIKTDTQRMPRTGLQKEGSRVIFGVPKPGKKRKFMEVSKHYVADRKDKVDDGNESVKLANFLMPQGPAFRGWKNNAKNDTKEKRGANSKSKTVKSGKPGVLGKPIPLKDNPSENAVSLPNDLTDHKQKIKDSESENHAEMASYSANDGAAEGPILYPPLATSSDAPSSNRTTTSRASKGKLAPAGGKLGKIEEEKPTTETSEPRRSNRRIQPTSRLLEGLQSYLIISKIPSVSHDRGHKNQNRNASRGNNQG